MVTIPYSNFSRSTKDSWVVSFSTRVPTENAKSLTLLYIRGDSHIILGKIGVYSEIEDITIPYSNFSQSTKDSWVVSFSTQCNSLLWMWLCAEYKKFAQRSQSMEVFSHSVALKV